MKRNIMKAEVLIVIAAMVLVSIPAAMALEPPEPTGDCAWSDHNEATGITTEATVVGCGGPPSPPPNSGGGTGGADPCVVSLPTYSVIMNMHYTMDDSYFGTTISGIVSPHTFDVTNGLYDGWCIEYGTSVIEYTDIPVYLYSSYCPPAYLADPDWGYVNHILNNKLSDDWKDVQ